MISRASKRFFCANVWPESVTSVESAVCRGEYCRCQRICFIVASQPGCDDYHRRGNRKEEKKQRAKARGGVPD